MLKYIGMWKLREDAGDEGKKIVEQYLDELPRRVGWVRSWSWGEALRTVGDPHTFGFVAEFDDEKALRGYLTHSERLAVEKRVAPYLASTLTSFYETP